MNAMPYILNALRFHYIVYPNFTVSSRILRLAKTVHIIVFPGKRVVNDRQLFFFFSEGFLPVVLRWPMLRYRAFGERKRHSN